MAATFGDGGGAPPAAAYEAHGSPALAAADSGVGLTGRSGSRASSAMVGVPGAAVVATAGQAGSVAAPADGEPMVFPVSPEDIASLPFGPAVDAQLGFGPIEAGLLNRFAPPAVLAEAAQAVEQLAVRLEEEGGDGWAPWAWAAGLAAVAGELARRQLRRRLAVRTVPAWSRGGLDGF